jgi:thiol-disulfide isomerase/thioredoxin
MRLLPLLAALLVLPAFAADKKEKTYELRDFAWGKAVSGPAATPSKLAGKAVVLECWGVQCPPCIASLPHMQELSVKYKDTLTIVGAECQGHSPKEIGVVTKKAGVEYAIVSGLSKTPIQFSGIPKVFVFDNKGKLVFDGNPADDGFMEAVKKVAEKPDAKAAPATTPAPGAKPAAAKAV